MNETTPTESGVVEAAVDVMKTPLSVDIAGVGVWHFVVMTFFLAGCFFILRPVWAYVKHLLRDSAIKKYSFLRMLAGKKGLVLLIALVITAYVSSLYYSGVIDPVKRITIVMWIMLLTKLPYALVDRHFTAFCEVAWGPRKATYDIIAGFVKLVITFLSLLAILNVFRLSINDFSEANIPAWVTGLSVLIFYQPLSTWAGIWIVTFTHPFSRGDYVEIKDKSGTVIQSTLTSTTLLGPSGETTTVSHKGIDAASITNFSTRNMLRQSWSYDLFANTDSDTLEKFSQRAAAIINAHAECVLISCGYEGGVNGSHRFGVLFNIMLAPPRLSEIDRVKNVVHCDIVSVAEEVGVNFSVLKQGTPTT